jgi:hypothetical protein
MPDPTFIQLPFGPGLDKESGAMVVRPNTMQDLRNVYHHEGSLVVREGVLKTNEFFDGESGWSQGGQTVGTGDDATHILAGIAIRSERAGIVVSWHATHKRVAIWRVNALGEESVFVGFWPFRSDPYGNVASTGDFEWPVTDPPKVVLAEMYGQVFFAHDTYYDAFRADTYHYDPWGLVTDDTRLKPLSGRFIEGEGLEVIRFRGVVRHLHYLFGWGWGTSQESRPELVRVSLPGEPDAFDPNHYFIAGDRRDPVIACASARQTLIVCKETESYQIIGYSRANFGIRPYDQLYGALASRLITSVSGTVYVWSAEGPMMGTDVGPFEKIWLPLDLGGFEPATLIPRVEFKEGWADYIDEVELVIFCFGQRAYILSVRNPADPRWTYWELGKKAFCGFRLYGGEDIGGVPTGYADVDSVSYEVEGCGVYPRYTIAVTNYSQGPTDLVQVYHRPLGPFWLDNILADALSVDTDGDGVPDGWEVNQSAPTYQAYFDGTQAAYKLSVGNTGSSNTTTASYIELLWTTGAVVVGDKYRFEADCYTPVDDGQVWNNAPWELRCQFYDVGDNPVGAIQSRNVRAPVFQRSYLEVTAPATATYAKVGLRCDVRAAGQQLEGLVRNPMWREQDTAPGDWVPAAAPSLVSPETTQELGPYTVGEPGMDYEFAIRYVNLGLQAPAGYEDTDDPSTWPAVSRGTAEIPMDAPDWTGFFGIPPNLVPIQFVENAVSRYFEMVPGCDPNNNVGTSYLKYTNRDLEVYENDVLIGYMHRGELAWFRQLRSVDKFNTYQYKMRYIGPDRNSPFGATITAVAGEVEEERPPEIISLQGDVPLLYAYQIKIRLTDESGLYDHNADGVKTEPIGIEIQDNYTPQGGGGTLPAGEWNRVWVSHVIDLAYGGTRLTYPPADLIEHDRKADGVTVSVRVREFYEPFPDYFTDPIETFEPTNVSPWSDVKTVTI